MLVSPCVSQTPLHLKVSVGATYANELQSRYYRLLLSHHGSLGVSTNVITSVIRPADTSIHGAILVINPIAIGMSDTNMLSLESPVRDAARPTDPLSYRSAQHSVA